jgi:NAD(P)-dependent dehydrogenase (short-subunit alcohol dehydrogenase family)
LKLENKVAVVTGGTSGIGEAICLLFAKEGARVVVAGRSESRGTDVAEKIKAAGGEAVFVRTDVAELESLERLARAAVESFGRVDVLVNNAGMALVKNIVDTTEEEYDQVMDVNLKSIYRLSKLLLPQMLERRSGAIINVASQLALVAAPNFAVYAASKGAILNLSRAMALDCAKHGVRVNTLCPGAVETPLLMNQFKEEAGPQGGFQDLVDLHPLGRIGRPEEIASAALFLATDDSSFVTGAPLVVDGGYIAW